MSLMTKTFQSYFDSFFISNNSVVNANEIKNETILGKATNDSFTFVKISKYSLSVGKINLILTDDGMLFLDDSIKIYGIGHKFRSGGASAANLQIGDKILNCNLGEFGNITNFLKNPLNSKTDSLSYLCGFQSALIRKFLLKYKGSFSDIFSSQDEHVTEFFNSIRFIDIENEIFTYSSSNQNPLIFAWISFHKSKNLQQRNLSIKGKLYQNRSFYLSSGIIQYSIKNCNEVDYLYRNRFFPSFCKKFDSNSQFFLVGFLTAIFWDCKITYGKCDKFPSIQTKGEFKIPDMITIVFRLTDVLGLYIGRMLAIYGLECKYSFSDDDSFYKISVNTENIINLLNNNLTTSCQRWSTIIKKIELNNVPTLNFIIESEDFLWRPILDFTIAEI